MTNEDIKRALDMCACGHPRRDHAPRLPAPCGHGRTMPDHELIARACDPDLTLDPAYGCRYIGWRPRAHDPRIDQRDLPVCVVEVDPQGPEPAPRRSGWSG